jgi:hypothetical protein
LDVGSHVGSSTRSSGERPAEFAEGSDDGVGSAIASSGAALGVPDAVAIAADVEGEGDPLGTSPTDGSFAARASGSGVGLHPEIAACVTSAPSIPTESARALAFFTTAFMSRVSRAAAGV